MCLLGSCVLGGDDGLDWIAGQERKTAYILSGLSDGPCSATIILGLVLAAMVMKCVANEPDACQASTYIGSVWKGSTF